MAEFESTTYRRGLTLGLTMAEIFLLVLFLLLLTFLPLHHEYEQTKETLTDVKEELKEIAAKHEDRASLPEEIQILKRKNTELEKTIAEIEKQNTITKDLLEESKEKQGIAEQSLENERKELPDDVRKLVEQIDQLKSDMTTIEEENADLRKKLNGVDKGVDPPCWYEVVTRKEKRHEKPHYLLDVAVHDEHLRVRVNKSMPLPGYAIDENDQSASTSYAEEYAKLPLTSLAAVKEKQFSLEEFQAIAEPIKQMGKTGQIRKYECVFYAKIWDHTSTTAKKIWQQSRAEIEDFFYPFLVENDPWE